MAKTTNHSVIVLLGESGAGKSTAADMIQTRLQAHPGTRVRQLAFASRLKDVVAVLFGWDREMLEGGTPASRAWRTTEQPKWGALLNIPAFTPLKALRLIGSEALRDHFAKDLWLAIVFMELENSCCGGRETGEAEEAKTDTPPSQVVTIITDCRFPNEIAMLRSRDNVVFLHVAAPKPPEWWDLAAKNPAAVPAKWPDLHASEYSWVADLVAMPDALRVINDKDAGLAVLEARLCDVLRPKLPMIE